MGLLRVVSDFYSIALRIQKVDRGSVAFGSPSGDGALLHSYGVSLQTLCEFVETSFRCHHAQVVHRLNASVFCVLNSWHLN